MAENPSWLDYLNFATSSRQLPAPEIKPVLINDLSGLSPQERRLRGEPDLEKQVRRLERDQAAAGILGVEAERPRGLLGYLKEGAAEAIDNPVVKGLFQAMSVINAGMKQVVNTVGTAAESEINPLVWLNNRMDEYLYGRVRTQEEREQAIEQRLQGVPGAAQTSRFLSESLGVTESKPAERPSMQQFVDDVKNYRGAGELFGEIKLTEDAGVLEKAWKLPAAFVLDVRSAGGPRGFVRFGANNMTRKGVAETLGNQAKETFKTYAKRGADETEQAFEDRATLFAAKVTNGNLNSRSAGVSDAFEREFGKKVGKEAFMSMPKDLRGGLGIGFYDSRFGNLNQGGYMTRAVAEALKMDPKLLGTKWNPVVGYQALKNSARVTGPGRLLNHIGIESGAWANFVRASVKNANDADLTQAYKEFMTPAARDPAGRLAEIVGEETLAAKGWLEEYSSMYKDQRALYDRTNELIIDPKKLEGATDLDELDRAAVYYAQMYRKLFDDIHARFVEEGLPVDYLNEFHPVIFNKQAMDKDNVDWTDLFKDAQGKSIADRLGFDIGGRPDVTKPGLVNVPGRGYDPTKERSIFIVPIKNVDGTDGFRSATIQEMQDQLLEAGMKPEYLKYLKSNPGEILADYTDRATKVIARKKLVNELFRAGLLFRGNVPRVSAQYNLVENVIAGMRPDQLDRLTKDFMRDETRFTDYVGQLNDRLAKAYDSSDPLQVKQADQEIATFMNSIERLGDVYIESVMEPKALANYRRLLDQYDEAVDLGDTQRAAQRRRDIETAKRDAMKVVKEGPRTRTATLEKNVERKAFQQYMEDTLGLVGTSDRELKKLYNLSDLGALDKDNIKGVARIPDELVGTIASQNLRDVMGKWLSMNTRHALDDDMQTKFINALNAATQGFRTGATFGGGPGFVGRNGIGATFNGVMVADASADSYLDMNRVWWTRLTTDLALSPLETLRGSKATEYLEKLIDEGKLVDEAAALARVDILNAGKVTVNTVAKIRNQTIIERLSQMQSRDYDGTLDVLYDAMKLGGVYDPYQSVAMYSGLKRDANLASLLNSDTDWISIRNDRKPIRAERVEVTIPLTGAKVSIKKPTFVVQRGEDESTGAAFIRGAKATVAPTEEDPRSVFQKATEAYLNAGVDIKANGRTFNLRPVQLVRDLNQNMEEYHRGAAISAGLRKYGTTEAGKQNAVGLMRLAHFDYSNLTEAERSLGRFVLPFYTWTRYNIPLQFRMLVNQPGTFNTVLEGWDTVKGIIGDPNGDMYFMPEYAQEAYAFMLNPELQGKLEPIMNVLGADPNNPLAVRLESPILDLNKYFTEGKGALPVSVDFEEFQSGMNPFVKAFIQYTAEKNLYTGRTYSAEGVEAPAWYQAISTMIAPFVPSAQPLWDPEDQVYKVDEKWLDVFKTVLPMATTQDRTTLPAIEAALEAAGFKVNLSNEDEKLFSSILSKGLAAPITTVTPETEAGEVASRYRYVEEQITTSARRQRINEKKLEEFVKAATNAGMEVPDIIRRGRALAESGYFA